MTEPRDGTGRRARRGVALFALATVLAWLAATTGAQPAFACSCADPELGGVLAGAEDEALVLAERLDLDGGPEGELRVLETLAGGPVVGRVDARFDDGGSCDPGLPGGAVGALLLAHEDDRWTTTMCGQLRVGDAFAAVGAPAEPADDADGPTLLLGGDYGGPRLATVDPAGRVTTWGGERGGRAAAVARCPDDAVLLEVATDEEGSPSLHRWSLPDLEPLGDPVTLGAEHAFTAAVRCLDAAGARAVVVLPAYGEPGAIALVDGDDVDTRSATVQGAAANGDVVAVLTGGATAPHQGPETVATVTESGEVVPLVTVPGTVFDRIEVSPSGTHVAAAGYPSDGEGDHVVVLRIADGHAEDRVLPGFHMLGWLDADRLWLRDEGGGAFGAATTELELLDTTLAPVGRLAVSPASHVLALPDGGVLQYGLAPPSATRDDGTVRAAELRLTGTTVALPLDPDRVLVEAPAEDPTATPTPARSPDDPVARGEPEEPAPARSTAIPVAALAAVLLVGAAGLWYRQRRS